MPLCKECGVDLPRTEMFGTGDELRCPTCAHKLRQRVQKPRRSADWNQPAVLSFALVSLAVVASLIDWHGQREWVFQGGRTEALKSIPEKIWAGEVWRFLTTVLPHGGFFHLLFNCYWTWRFGRAIESALGSVRIAGVVALCAIGAHSLQFLSEPGVAIGLSGVGYGMFGFLYALRQHKDYAAREIQPDVVKLFVVWFFACIFLTYIADWRVANMAHGAGAVSGWLLGRAMLIRHPKLAIAGLTAAAAGLLALTMYMPWNGEYCLYRGRQELAASRPADALRWLQAAQRRLPDTDPQRFTMAVDLGHLHELVNATGDQALREQTAALQRSFERSVQKLIIQAAQRLQRSGPKLVPLEAPPAANQD